MPDDRAKTPRTLLVADHLWEAFSTMAAEMGGDRDSLVNQALYAFARLHGFLVPADLQRLRGDAVSSASPAANTTPTHAFAAYAPSAPPEASRPRAGFSPPPTQQSSDDHRALRPQANPDRMAEIAQQLAGSGMPARSGSNPPPVPSAKDPGSPVEVDGSLLVDEGSSTSLDLPNLSAFGPSRNGAAIAASKKTLPVASDPGQTPEPGAPRSLVLLADGRELDRVVKERFLIGRGKHCDLIINSGKVSREHAAITREGSSWFIEDLGSSNGTWHEKRRIGRRQIEDGDEYFICAEKIGCTFR